MEEVARRIGMEKMKFMIFVDDLMVSGESEAEVQEQLIINGWILVFAQYYINK